MIIYRIENDQGNGPYQDGDLMRFHRETFIKDEDSDIWFNSHPNPWNELHSIKKVFNNYRINRQYHCGFSTIKQMKAWFDEDKYFYWMHNRGFKLVVYHGPARYGNYQALIKKSEAVKIREASLLKYIN